jgi:hypothetical protein
VKRAATPNTLDLLESALDEIASINVNDEGTWHAVHHTNCQKLPFSGQMWLKKNLLPYMYAAVGQ